MTDVTPDLLDALEEELGDDGEFISIESQVVRALVAEVRRCWAGKDAADDVLTTFWRQRAARLEAERDHLQGTVDGIEALCTRWETTLAGPRAPVRTSVGVLRRLLRGGT